MEFISKRPISYIAFALMLLQLLVLKEVLPSLAKPFDIYHEDIIFYILIATTLITLAIENKKDK